MSVLDLGGQNDGNNDTVDGQDTGHDDGDQRLEHEFTLENTDGGNAHTGFSSSVSASKVGEDESGGDSHESEERVLVGVLSYKQVSELEKAFESTPNLAQESIEYTYTS